MVSKLDCRFRRSLVLINPNWNFDAPLRIESLGVGRARLSLRTALMKQSPQIDGKSLLGQFMYWFLAGPLWGEPSTFRFRRRSPKWRSLVAEPYCIWYNKLRQLGVGNVGLGADEAR